MGHELYLVLEKWHQKMYNIIIIIIIMVHMCYRGTRSAVCGWSQSLLTNKLLGSSQNKIKANKMVKPYQCFQSQRYSG